MTALFFGGTIALVLFCWFLLVASGPAGEGGRAKRSGALAAMALAPPLLFGSVVVAAFVSAPAGDYRVALEAVSFTFDDGAVTVGGGSAGDEADDLIVRDLPPRYLTFRREGAGVVVELPPELDHAAEEPAYAAVRVDGVKPFANSVLISERVDIGGLVFDPAGRRFTASGATYREIPQRRQELWKGRSIPIRRNLTAETVMYPLRFWMRPEGTEEPAADRNGAPLGSFLSFEGGFRRSSLYLTLTGDGTSVAAAGKTTAYQRRVAELAPGESRHFALYRLDYADPLRGDDGRNAAQERRSFQATFREGRLTLVFDTADVFRLAPASVAALVEKQKEKDSFLLATRDPRRNAPLTASQMVLSFPQLGPRIQNELYSGIRIADVADCRLRVTTHTGTRCYALGDAFTIGADAAAVLRITQMRIPWGIVLTLFALGLLSIGWPRALGDHPAAAILISAAEVLLAVRLLVAFEGGVLDVEAAPALWESLVAFGTIPFALRAAWLFRTRREAAASAAGSTASPAAGSRAELVDVAVRAVAVTVLLGIAMWHARIDTRLIVIGAAAIPVLIAVAIAEGTWLAGRLARPLAGKALRKILLLAVVITVVRVAMWLLAGWKERISLFGLDLAVTVLYLPAVFLFFALLWQRFADAGTSALTSRSRIAIVLAVALGVLLTIVLPYLVRDSGSAFVHAPAVMLLFALPMLSRRPTLRTFGAGFALLLLLGAHVAFLFVPHLRGVDELDQQVESEEYRAAKASEDEAVKLLESRLAASTNDLRVISHIAPHQLEEAGTSKAEGLVAQRRMLDRYSGRKLLGAGYLDVPLASVFRDTHLNDNLSAIHILAPFGAVGGAAILVLFCALAVLPLAVVFRTAMQNDETPEEAIDGRSALGILCLWTFSIAGIYMFAANAGLVLFTGKNVYLLAAASKSDAVEGGMLLLLALLALHEGKKETPEGAAVEEGSAA